MENTKIRIIMQKVYTMMSDPSISKKDLLIFIKNQIDEDPSLSDIFGYISSNLISEIEQNEQLNISQDILVQDNFFQVLDVSALDKQTKKTFVSIPSKQEARYLEDIYYQTQGKRIVIQNQIRALRQGFDNDIEDNKGSKNISFLEWYLYNTQKMEQQIAKALELFSDSNYLSKWAKQVKGIGPVIATRLVANLEIKENKDGSTNMHAGNWWMYCGLNDNNRPWLGKAECTKIVNELLKECSGIIDDEFVYKLSEKTKWKFSYYEKNAKNENGTWSKEKLISSSCIIPYNKKLKTLMYTIGHSFLLCKNKPDSLYGRILKERMEYENAKNLAGDYADQANEILKNKNIGKNTVAYNYYSKGQLPPAHITARCMRFATKLFISHLFEAAYYNKYGKMCPNPYVIEHGGHSDYIGPEVPYDSIERDLF